MQCRQSGLSDAQWCRQNGIPDRSFYNAVSRLRKKSCSIPESSVNGRAGKKLDLTSESPDGSSLFLFCGRHSDRIKAILKEPDGFVLIYKKLTTAYGRYR